MHVISKENYYTCTCPENEKCEFERINEYDINGFDPFSCVNPKMKIANIPNTNLLLIGGCYSDDSEFDEDFDCEYQDEYFDDIQCLDCVLQVQI